MKLQITYNEMQILIRKKTGKTVCFRKAEDGNTVQVTYTVEVDVPLIGKISKNVDGKIMFNGITDTVLDITYSLSLAHRQVRSATPPPPSSVVGIGTGG